jgi:hypothetical protein
MLKSWSAVQGLLIHLGFPLRGLAISARGKKKRFSRAEGAKDAEEEVLFPAWLGDLCEKKKRGLL